MLRFLLAVCMAIVSFIILFALGGAWILVSTPRPTNIKSCFTTKMNEVHLCPKDPSYVRIREVPHGVKMAVIVSEDGSFYDHKGFDWFELRESIKKDLKTGHFSRGGSTITQQLAKNLYLSKEKSLFRKIREAIIASQIEEILTKEEILEKYFNVVEFGPEIYGVKAAAKFYFSKNVSDLTTTEGAWLAMLLPNPTKNYQSFRKGKLTPFAHKEIVTIINRLVAFHKISQASAEESLMEMDVLFNQARPAAREQLPDVDTTEHDVESSEDEDDGWFGI